jgi:7-keto-8-aminopelargonate synthetase-like enzyme
MELEKKGFDIRAIRPPTVKQSRLRMSLNVSIDDSSANAFLNCLDNSLRQ